MFIYSENEYKSLYMERTVLLKYLKI